ncbi:MAG: flagellar type III secretion system pore protein FliP [Vampirovibrionales bacterium]|nr:flagellar type III secretion system pore protein FliP [Vampirovibrionales bacterium]
MRPAWVNFLPFKSLDWSKLTVRLNALGARLKPFLGWIPLLILVWLLPMVLIGTSWAAPVPAGLPTIEMKLGTANSPQEVSQGLQILILLTVLTLAPALMILTTAFTRIVIVMSLVRQAIGIPNLPPNQVILGLSLILTFFVMAPTFNTINEKSLQPYLSGVIPQQAALETAVEPLRMFMFKQTHEKDIALFTKLAKLPKPKVAKDVPTYVLLPAFLISELKTAFQLGFMVFLPFLVIDLVISSVLVSMGMMFLPPATIALPFKIILFVLADGWHLICEALVSGFG